MTRWTFAIVAGALGLALAVPAEAQWKWRDSTGRTQYSDLPPPATVPERDILGRPSAGRTRIVAPAASAASGAAAAPGPTVALAGSPAAPAAPAASSALAPKTVEPELEQKRKKAEAEQAEKAKAEETKVAAAKADNCSRAKAQMRSLDSGVRIARVNEKGEREVLDDRQRADESKRARDIIAADCR